MLRELYAIDWGNDVVGGIAAEFENVGKVGVVAFKGKLVIADDLGEQLASQEVRYTSDTKFVPPEGDAKTRHLIAPGEKFVLMTISFRGAEDQVFATTKETAAKIVSELPGFPEKLQLADFCVKKRHTLEIEKVVTE